LLFEEWLPSFEQMATWTDSEKLIQLAGYLRGKEWSLLRRTDKAFYITATAILQEKLDPSRKALATQDFHQGRMRLSQIFILRLGQTFC